MSALLKQSTEASSSSKIWNFSLNADKSASAKDAPLVKTFDRPFVSSLEEELWNNKATLKILTALYGLSHLEPQIKSQLFSQIDWLLDSDGWQEDDNLADSESFKTLIKFVLNANLFQAPYLSLTDEGNIVGTWINEENKLRLECFANDRVRWLVSCRIEGQIENATGNTQSLHRLFDVIAPYKSAGWFKP